MPFCHSPWTNIDISPQGKIAPCCKFRHDQYAAPLDIKNSSVEDYLQSQTLIQIKQDFRKGEWPVGCERCRIEEENQIKSKRILDHDRWKKHYDVYDLDSGKFITASVAFGNTCNLKCITCGPHASSRWHKEHLDLFGIDIPSNHFYKQGFVEELGDSMPGLIHLDIPGGEPFVSGVEQQFQLLSSLRKRASEITLHYTTNAAIFPEDRWWNCWKDFQEIDLQISLDGIGERFEYIRYPAVWSEVVHNIDLYLQKQKTLHNFRLSVSVCVSAYNIGYLDEILSWCHDKGLPSPWLGRLHTPSHMRPTIYPDKIKSKIIETLQKSPYNELKSWAKLLISIDDSHEFSKFVQRTQQHDLYRSTDFCKTFGEMT